MEKLEKIGLKIMACIGTVLLFFLLWYSWRYTMRLYYSEAILDYRDQPVTNLLFLVGILALVAVCSRAAQKLSEKTIHIIAGACALLVVAAGCILAYCADVFSVADQAQLYMGATSFFTGDTDWLLDYEYFYMFPFQFGMVEFYALLFKLVGVADYLVIGCAQSVATGLTVYMGFRITKELFRDKRAECVYLFCALGFLPLYTYCIYIYGEAFGICLLMLSVWFFLLANRGENTRKKQILFFALSTLFMVFAYVARRGFLVIWVAMVIMQLLICLKRKRILPLAAVILMYLFMTLGQMVSIQIAENVVGRDYSKSCPTIMWVAMGFMDAMDGNMSGPGSYNDFNRLTYMDCNYDEEAAAGIAKEYIADRLGEWIHHPADMVRFFKEKTLVQWNEPTYGAFAMTYFMDKPKEWVYKLYMDEEISAKVRRYLNHYQAVAYLTILGYFILILRGKLDERQSFPGLIFLGGFCLSMLWETKSRYVYPYMVMILPCMAGSLVYYTDKLTELLKIRGKRAIERLQNKRDTKG